MFLTKRDDGSYLPSHDSDYKESQKVKTGDEVRATRARNVKYHRKGFALLKLGFDNQDKFDNFDIYRQVVSIKAGFAEWVTGNDKVRYPMAKSLSFDRMGAKEFESWYEAILTVISKEIKLTGPEIEAEIASFF